MKTAAIALALGTMLTVEQRDAHRSSLDPRVVSGQRRRPLRRVHHLLRSSCPPMWITASDVYVLDRARQHVTLESTDTGDVHRRQQPSRHQRRRAVRHLRARQRRRAPRPPEGVTTIIGEGDQPAIAENGQIAFSPLPASMRVTEADMNGEQKRHLLAGSAWRASRSASASN